MAIHVSDWTLQYFEDVPCPQSVRIPTADPECWSWYPRHNWVYNKLQVARTQGLAAAPHGVVPDHFPVFSKPITNLHGMGAGSVLLRNEAEYDRCYAPGHMWMDLLEGDHVSTDVAVVNGEPVWWRHATGLPGGHGMFDYWTIHARPFPAVEEHCGAWMRQHLDGYTGMVNLETIGARIIELHLRFADQWPDLYGGRPWIEAAVRLYGRGLWQLEEESRREGYSVVLFGPQGRRYRHPDPELRKEIRAMPGITSVQITFHEDRAPEWHSNPPGGFRLAIVNCHDLEAGRAARERLVKAFRLGHAVNDTRLPRLAASATVTPLKR